MSDNSREFEGDAGAPLPDFSGARNISLTTVAPALGVGSQQGQQPDYLDFDQKGRGVVVTMFANAGLCYLVGIGGGGEYSKINSFIHETLLRKVFHSSRRE